MKSGGNTKKKRPDDACIHCHTFEEFSDFFIFPHEFLCLLCNANDRMNLHDNIDRPNMKLRKTEIFNIASKILVHVVQNPVLIVFTTKTY